MHPWKFSNVSVSITSCDSAWIFPFVSKRRPLSRNFILENRKKVVEGVVSRIGGVGNHYNFFVSQELSNNEWCVSGRVVMVKKPVVVLPLVWTFAPNAHPQPLQNLTVKLAIDGLTRGYEFLVDSALDVEKKNDQHGLEIAANLTRFFRPLWIWRLPLRRLLLSLRVITTHPCFITACDIGDEAGVVSGLLFEFPADRHAMDLMVIAQQSWHISQKCVSCSNCPPKCVERSRMTVLLSHKHRG